MNFHQQNNLLHAILFVLVISSCQSRQQESTKNEALKRTELTQPTVEKIVEKPDVKKDTAISNQKSLPPQTIISDEELLRKSDTAFVNIKSLSKRILVDIRYATDNNFLKEKIYDCGECYMRLGVAKRLLKADTELEKKGLTFKMFDCYRPRPYQQRLWDKKPDARYVAPPAKGSMHARGAALDLTIARADTGEALDMGTEFDFFGEKAYQTCTDLAPEVLENRKLLRDLMTSHGFKITRTEWWHYSLEKGFKLSSWVWDCK